MSSRTSWFAGFLSLFGLLGFRYFTTHDPSYLNYFAFFAFLSNFFLARINLSILDERYYEDVREAKAFAFDVALAEIVAFFIINVIMSMYLPAAIIEHVSVGLIAICYASLVTAYGIKLYNLEER